MICCEISHSCILFKEQLFHTTLTFDYLKAKYCDGDFRQCARYILTQTCGSDKVPTYLYPDDIRQTIHAS